MSIIFSLQNLPSSAQPNLKTLLYFNNNDEDILYETESVRRIFTSLKLENFCPLVTGEIKRNHVVEDQYL